MADKKPRTTTTRRKPASSRPAAPAVRRGKKTSKERVMPAWLRTIVAVCIIAVFSAGFYWFFIRPYAYRWKPCAGQKDTVSACPVTMKCMVLTFLIIRGV